jgi:hypothetical protein
MKKLIALLTIAGMMTFGLTNVMIAQETEEPAEADTTAVVEKKLLQQKLLQWKRSRKLRSLSMKCLKEQFIEGGPAFMGIVLLVLIFGLAISIERIIYLTLSATNTKSYCSVSRTGSKMVVLKKQRTSAATPAGRWPAFSTRDCCAMIQALRKLKNQLCPMVQLLQGASKVV